jgi:hypothetical protein
VERCGETGGEDQTEAPAGLLSAVSVLRCCGSVQAFIERELNLYWQIPSR